MLLEERQNSVIEQLCGRDGRLTVTELGNTHFAIAVDEGLLVDAADAFQGANVEGVLRLIVPGHSLSNSPWASLSVVAFSKATI